MKFPVLRRVLSVLLGPFIGRVEGIENIPKSGGAILAANHASYLDHFIIGVCIFARINRMIYFLAKKEHFETPLQRFWHRYLQAIPIDREAGGKDALAEAVHHLRRGDLIMIYPEGTRTRDGALQRAKTGVARLAFAAHVPVVPIGITNTFFILPKANFSFEDQQMIRTYFKNN